MRIKSQALQRESRAGRKVSVAHCLGEVGTTVNLPGINCMPLNRGKEECPFPPIRVVKSWNDNRSPEGKSIEILVKRFFGCRKAIARIEGIIAHVIPSGSMKCVSSALGIDGNLAATGKAIFSAIVIFK